MSSITRPDTPTYCSGPVSARHTRRADGLGPADNLAERRRCRPKQHPAWNANPRRARNGSTSNGAAFGSTRTQASTAAETISVIRSPQSAFQDRRGLYRAMLLGCSRLSRVVLAISCLVRDKPESDQIRWRVTVVKTTPQASTEPFVRAAEAPSVSPAGADSVASFLSLESCHWRTGRAIVRAKLDISRLRKLRCSPHEPQLERLINASSRHD